MAYSGDETIARTRVFFDERAAKWDTMISAGHGDRLRKIVETLSIQPNAVVLDVGTGTGILLPILADLLNTQGKVVAVDISFKMMQETGNRVNALCRKPSPPLFSLLQADIVAPPLQDSFFDWIICNSCFPHFHDQQQAVCTMGQLLKPGGKMVVCHTESRDAINELHRTVGGIVGGHELPEDTSMRKLIANAGLQMEILDSTPDYYLLAARRETS